MCLYPNPQHHLTISEVNLPGAGPAGSSLEVAQGQTCQDRGPQNAVWGLLLNSQKQLKICVSEASSLEHPAARGTMGAPGSGALLSYQTLHWSLSCHRNQDSSAARAPACKSCFHWQGGRWRFTEFPQGQHPKRKPPLCGSVRGIGSTLHVGIKAVTIVLSRTTQSPKPICSPRMQGLPGCNQGCSLLSLEQPQAR